MHELATFGAGCFWGVEWVFRQVPGVTEAVSGYAGRLVEDPDYRLVCTGTTGHAEVVQVEFDPASRELRPAARGVLGDARPDPAEPSGSRRRHRSTAARSSRTPRSSLQRPKRRAIERRQRFDRPIATEIEEAGTFYPAEDYHQRYYEQTGHEPYCHVLPVGVLERLGLVRSA